LNNVGFDWSEYYKLSEALHKDPNIFGYEEATFRTIASRAYYAAFKCAMNFAQGENYIPFNNGNDHEAIRRYFRNDPKEPIRIKISADLDRLCKNRTKADYWDHFDSTPRSLAYYSLSYAKKILENLSKLVKS